MITPRISMVAYDCRTPGFILVAVPNERGRYVRTDRSVALVTCPDCGAQVGEPCLSRGLPGDAAALYCGGTHYARRIVAKRIHRQAHDVIESPILPPPVPDECMEAEA